MSNVVELPSVVPDYLKNDARVAALLAEAAAGIGGGMPPTIGLNGTRFVFKEAGKDDENFGGLELPVIILRGKAALEKKWYATKYDPKQEAQSPDCYSLDGIKPDPSSRLEQCKSCAGCPQNVFGSGTNAAGEPGKGKACSDNKILAVFVNKKGIFRFPLPPASLGAFGSYCKQLGGRGLPLQGVLTIIGFDAGASFPKLTFGFGGMVPEANFPKLMAMVESPEVNEIVTGTALALPAPTNSAVGQIEDTAAQEKAAAEKLAAEKKAAEEKAAAEKKAKAVEAAAKKKKADEEKAAAASGKTGAGVDLMDMGMGGDAAEQMDLGDPGPASGGLADASVESVIDALGLDL